MSNDLIFTNNQPLAVPDFLQGTSLSVSHALLATIGQSGNRLSLKGNRFRQYINGKEEGVFEENYLDVIVLGAVPSISRLFYEGVYDPDTKSPPTCYSTDGIVPNEDVKNKQSAKCATCPQNQVGSKIVNNKKIRACSFFQRLVVQLAGDLEGMKYTLDVKSMGLFGESHKEQNKYNLRDYVKFVANRGVDIAALVTRMSFDTDQSVPKLLFAPARFITAEEYAVVSVGVVSEEVKHMLDINMNTMDLSAEIDKTEEAMVAAAKEPPTPQVKEIPVATVTTPTPTPAPAKSKLVMSAKADGIPYADWVKEGWTPETLVAEGYATIVPATPAAPPKPTVPVAPAKPAVPAVPKVISAPPQPTKAQTPTPAKPKPPTPAQAAPAAPPKPVETATDEEVQALLDSLS